MTQEIKNLATKTVIDFCDWYFDGDSDRHNIAEDYFGIWELNDEYWGFSDIVRALDKKHDITPDKLSEWYWNNVESEQKMNLRSFLMFASKELYGNIPKI